jgi:hypothetical protein
VVNRTGKDITIEKLILMKEQTMISKTLHRKLKTGSELRCSGRLAVPAPHVALVVLLW